MGMATDWKALERADQHAWERVPVVSVASAVIVVAVTVLMGLLFGRWEQWIGSAVLLLALGLPSVIHVVRGRRARARQVIDPEE